MAISENRKGNIEFPLLLQNYTYPEIDLNY